MWRSANRVKMTSTKDHSGLRAPCRDLMRLSTASAGTSLVGLARYSWWPGTPSSRSQRSTEYQSGPNRIVKITLPRINTKTGPKGIHRLNPCA